MAWKAIFGQVYYSFWVITRVANATLVITQKLSINKMQIGSVRTEPILDYLLCLRHSRQSIYPVT